MNEKTKDYRTLLRHLVGLQQKLIKVFEKEVKILPLLPTFPEKLRSKLKRTIKPKNSISQILRAWPVDVPIMPLVTWVSPRKGVVTLEGKHWFFDIHGQTQVTFIGLPADLDIEIFSSLQAGNSDILINLTGCGPNVEVQYLQGDRTDSFNVWSVFIFAGSIGSNLSNLSQKEHEVFLEQLGKEGFINSLMIGREQHFVLSNED